MPGSETGVTIVETYFSQPTVLQPLHSTRKCLHLLLNYQVSRIPLINVSNC